LDAAELRFRKLRLQIRWLTALLCQVDYVTRPDWTRVQDGGIDAGSTLVGSIQEFHQGKKRSPERLGRIVRNEAAARVALPDANDCGRPDADGPTYKAILTERCVRKIQIQVGTKTAWIDFLTHFGGEPAHCLHGNEGERAHIRLRGRCVGKDEFIRIRQVCCQVCEHSRRVNKKLFARRDTDPDLSVRIKDGLVTEHLAALTAGETKHARRGAGAFKGIKAVAEQS
jgi:hypothetical protein